jgi:hypothetical protein
MTWTVLPLLVVVGALPPKWDGRILLHKPLLPGTVTRLNGFSENECEAAIRLILAGTKHIDSEKLPAVVHDSYREAIFGEHLVVKPHQQPILPPSARDPILAIVVGFERNPETCACKITGVFTIDHKGHIRQYTEFKPSALVSFGGTLQQHCRDRIAAVKAVRRAVERNRQK